MRGVGVPSLLGHVLGPFVVVFALLTQFGDVWFLTLVVTLLYWLGPHTPVLGDTVERRRLALVVGLLVLSFVLVSVAKPLFGLPRPPGAGVPPHAEVVPDTLAGLYESLSTGSGFGFPSGHATSSTLVYGGLTWALTGRRRRQAAVAAGLVVLVSFSRLALGVHYLVDILAGIGLGLLALAVAIRLATPRRVFALGSGIALVGLLVVGPSRDPVVAAGAVVGATAAWIVVGDTLPEAPTRPSAVATVLAGVLTMGVLGLLAVAVFTDVTALAVLSVLGGASLVAMPLVGERVAKKRVVGT